MKDQVSAPLPAGRAAPYLFAAALFSSALLLFSIQPLIARMLLPLLGGTPSVWNTSMLFFQATLLAGYGYAHLVSRRLPVRWQAGLHLGLLLAAALVLPVHLPGGMRPPASSNPVGWALLLLLLAVGLPAFALSATAPLLQHWFSRTKHAGAEDPYFLYSASNLGSMIALLSYPFVIEPLLTIPSQTRAWTGFYLGCFLLFMAACATLVWRRGSAADAAPEAERDATHPTGTERLRWLLLALVPSSLLMGVTTHLTTNISPIPLLWVVPLALYLLTYVLAFAARPPIPHAVVVRVAPFFIVAMAFVFSQQGFGLDVRLSTFPLHLLTFFAIALVCHGELAARRPHTRHLTAFYVWISVGGVLGGVCNALVAPLVFRTVAEYPLALVAAAFLIPARNAGRGSKSLAADALLPAGLALVVAALARLPQARSYGGPPSPLIYPIFALAAIAVLFFRRRPLRFGLGIALVMLAGILTAEQPATVVHRERNYFGTIKVVAAGEYAHALYHGTIMHGAQNIEPRFRREPLVYYTRPGPLGELWTAQGRKLQGASIGVVGLGIGSIAAYGEPGQRMTFYEIDPAVERVARTPAWFTYLADCPAQTRVVIGDARLRLAAAEDHGYALLVLDAFSSDAIPVHLLTREAFQLYLAKLAPGGVITINASSSFLNLEPVLADLARDAGLVCAIRKDATPIVSNAEMPLKYPSIWVAFSRRPEDFGFLPAGWKIAQAKPGARVWSDHYANVLAAIGGISP